MSKKIKATILTVLAVVIVVGGVSFYNIKQKKDAQTAINAQKIELANKQQEQAKAEEQAKIEEQAKVEAQKKEELKKEEAKKEELKQAEEKKQAEIKQEEAKKEEAKKEEQKKTEEKKPATEASSVIEVVPEKGNTNFDYKMLSVISNTSVYSSASSSSSKVGSVSVSERVMFVSSDNSYIKIKYCNGDTIATGYVPSSCVKTAPVIPSDFNNLEVPGNVTKVQYGTSGQGRPLYYYKIGNGSKHILMNFAIHGYEDSWMQDGYALTQISEYLIKNLSKEQSNHGLNGWTVYVIPSSNPDGIVDGYTNNGPGRTQLSKSVDINRDFSGPGYTSSSSSRNKTSSPLSAPETQALAKLVTNLMSKDSKLIVTDTHGWLNFTKGNASVAPYFDKQFGFGNTTTNTYNGGFFVGYAKMKGAKELLIELPNPKNPNGVKSGNYNQKMLNSVNNLIDNYSF